MSEVILLNIFGLFGALPKIYKFVRNFMSKRPVGILIPIGKTTLSSKFSLNDKTVILDLEEAVKLSLTEDQNKRLEEYKASQQKTSYESLFFIQAKDYITQQKRAFPNKKFILVSSNRDLLKYVGCGSDEIISFVPSNSFFDRIKENISDSEKRKNLEEIRTTILLNNNKRKPINVFESFDQLTNMLGSILDLKVKL